MIQKNKNTFLKSYSEQYDIIYKKKNYDLECSRIKSFFRFKDQIKDILDLGCGTCSHSIILSQYGYNIHAVDKSNKMLEIAKKKIAKSNISNVKLIKDDIENLNLHNSVYDVVLLLFNVVGYLNNLEKFLFCIKKFMKKDSLLIFDFWHEDAIKFNGPGETSRTIKNKNYILEKTSKGKINKSNKTIDILIKTKKLQKNKTPSESQEDHSIKYYNINSLNKIIVKEGFKILKFEDFNKDNKSPNKNNWSAYCVSQFLG